MASIPTMLVELGLPWVMTSYKEKKKKMSGGLYNSTIKKLCPHSRCRREGQMWAVLCVNCRDIHMRNNCSKPKPRADHGSIWREQVPWRGSSTTHCGEHSLTYGQPGGRKLELLNILPTPPEKDRKPFLQLLPGQQSARRGFRGPSQETPCVLTGLQWSKH